MQTFIKFLFLVFCGIFLTSCKSADLTQSSSLPINTSSCIGGCVLQTHSFEVVQETTQQQLDLVIVIDNSNSMHHHQQKFASRFHDLFSRIKIFDWQMAFINTDNGLGPNDSTIEDGYHGAFYNLEDSNGEIEIDGNKAQILKSDLEEHYDLQELFAYTINRYQKGIRNIEGVEGIGSNIEQPLSNIINAINLRDSQNRGFFREDAALAVIILTNEDEEVFEGQEVTTPIDVINFVTNQLGSSKQFFSYGIIQTGEESCLRAEREYTHTSRYSRSVDELVRETFGITRSICEEDYSLILQNISHSLRGHVGFNIPLEHSRVVEDSIELIFFNEEGEELDQEDEPNWTFDAQTKQIVFDDDYLPQNRIHLQVTYQHY